MINQGRLPLANQLLRFFFCPTWLKKVLSFPLDPLDRNPWPGRVKPLFILQQAGMAGGWIIK